MGLSALPEFYTEAEQLVSLPHIKYESEPKPSTFFGRETLVYPGASSTNT